MSFIAELTPVILDSPEVLISEWNKQILSQPNIIWGNINYFDSNFFTLYFRELLDRCISVINVDIKRYAIMVQDINLTGKPLDNKINHLSGIHADLKRMCCLTIPITFSSAEPVCFYDDHAFTDNLNKLKNYPVLVHTYNHKYPSLVNTKKRHNIRVKDGHSPRILLQIEYDVPFDEIVAKNPSIWKII